MHALLAHAYHLAQHAAHLLTGPAWRPAAACLLVAACCRLLGATRSARGAAMSVTGAVLAGWLLLDPHALAWRPPPIARLPGVAALLLAEAAWWRGRRHPAGEILLAAAAAWWLCGAPGAPSALPGTVMVFLGLAAGLALSRRLAHRAPEGAGSVAALVLAAGLLASGASPHWSRAALLPGLAGLVLLGVRDTGAAIAGLVVSAAAAAMLASDRGRLPGVDLACLAPLAVWALARLLK